MLTNIFVNSVTLLNKAKGIVEQLLKEVDAEAISLQTYFYEQKDALYQDELRKLEQSLGDATKALKRAYAPLNFSAKVNIDRFEMSWWTRHRRPNGGTVIKKRIPWGMAKSKEHHGYYLPGLLVEAKKWEVDLVKEVEAHAMTLREARTALLELGTKFDVYRRLLDQSEFNFEVRLPPLKGMVKGQ